MNIRPATPADLDAIIEIDSVIESTRYLHVDRTADETGFTFKLEERPLRDKLVEPNRLCDDTQFVIKQIATGGDDGIVTVAEHDDRLVASLVAQERVDFGTLELIDLRVDYDYRRQGLATVLLFQLIERAKEMDLRAVHTTTVTNNAPAAALLRKLMFELSGMDLRRHTNHDLVKEAVILLWYYEVV